jgi:hypothetical protein
MATQTKPRPHTETSFDDAAERVRDLNERIISSSKKAGTASLDTYERALHSIADFTEKVGGASQNEWISAVAHAQADFTRDLTEAYTSSARTLLK